MTPQNQGSEEHEDRVCWLEHLRPIVDFADVGAQALHITRAEALAALQIAWIQRLVEEVCGDEEEEHKGEEWKSSP